MTECSPVHLDERLKLFELQCGKMEENGVSNSGPRRFIQKFAVVSSIDFV